MQARRAAEQAESRSPGVAGRDAARGRGDSRAAPTSRPSASSADAEARAQERQQHPGPGRGARRADERQQVMAQVRAATGRPGRHGRRSRHAQCAGHQRPARARAAVSDHEPGAGNGAAERTALTRSCPPARAPSATPRPRSTSPRKRATSTLADARSTNSRASCRCPARAPSSPVRPSRQPTSAPRSTGCCPNATPTIRNFLHILADRDRLDEVPGIAEALRELIDSAAASSPPRSRPPFRSMPTEQRLVAQRLAAYLQRDPDTGDDSRRASTRASSAASSRESATG